jgi:peptidoglycan/LPS O-acetylase OafA/YrhL
MSDDLDLAALLGEAPKTPDPGFRFDVLARTAERARRRASAHRALRVVIGSTLVGAAFAAFPAFGVNAVRLWPLLLVAGVLGLAYVLALLTVEGPRAALAQSRAMLRMPFLRA